MGGLSVLPRTSCGQSQLPCCRTSRTQAPTRNSLSKKFGAPVSLMANMAAPTDDSSARSRQWVRRSAGPGDDSAPATTASLGHGEVDDMGWLLAGSAVPGRSVAVHPELQHQEGVRPPAVVTPPLDVLVEQLLHHLAPEHRRIEPGERLAQEGKQRTAEPGREGNGEPPLHAPPGARRH